MGSDLPSSGPGDYVGIPRERIAWFPSIDPERCQPDRCQLNCVSWCERRVYARQDDGTMAVARPYECAVGDISCSFQCPFDAIRFPSKRELRAMLQEARRQVQ